MTRQSQKQLLISILLLLAGGCSHPVKKPAMPVKIPDSFSTAGTEPLPEKWWCAFEDDELDGLIDQALTNNFTLQTAWDHLAQAQAVAKKSGAILWPQADLKTGASRTRREEDNSTTYGTLYWVGLAASYEVDARHGS